MTTVLNLIIWSFVYSVGFAHIVLFAIIYLKHKNKIELFYLLVLLNMFLLSVLIMLSFIVQIKYLILILVNGILLLYITVPVYGYHLFGVDKKYFKFIPLLVAIEAAIENILMVNSLPVFMYVSKIVFCLLFVVPIFIKTKPHPKDSLEGVMQVLTRRTVIIFLAFMVVFIPFSIWLFELPYVRTIWWAAFTLSYQIPGLVYCQKYLFGKKAELSALSKRENEVAQAICEGLKYEEIAEKLFISVSTVKSHAFSVYKKLGVKNNRELMNFFMENK